MRTQTKIVKENSGATDAPAVFMPRLATFVVSLALACSFSFVAPCNALALEGETTPIVSEEAGAATTTSNEGGVAGDQVATNDEPAATCDEGGDNTDDSVVVSDSPVVSSNEGGDAGDQAVSNDDSAVTTNDEPAVASDEGGNTDNQTVVDDDPVAPSDENGDAGDQTVANDTSDDLAVTPNEAAEAAAAPAMATATPAEGTATTKTLDEAPATPEEEEVTQEDVTNAPTKATPGESTARQGHWVKRSGKSYFVWDDDGTDAKSVLVGPDNGAGYWAWLTEDGSVLCSKWDNGAGRVYVADSSGKLIGNSLTGNTSAWVVTNRYDGTNQRYWVDAETRAAVTGFFTVDGYGDVYGLKGKGYILRSTALKNGNHVILADKNGKLPTKAGWLRSSAYGQGEQLYWVEKLDNGFYGTKPGYSKGGYDHYTTNEGYVLRGSALKSGNYVILANINGKLPTKAGWLRTSGYDQGEQLYWIEKFPNGYYGTKPGYSKAGYAHYTTSKGYVLRSKALKSGNYVILANKNGKLPTKAGWLRTNAYGQGNQLYWIQKFPNGYYGTKPGFSKGGYAHYTTSSGYTLRSKALKYGKTVILADKDGRLPTKTGWLRSSAYGQGYQLYWIEKLPNGYLGTKPGYSKANYPHYTKPAGYVARNQKVTINGKTYDANKNGYLLGNTAYDHMLRMIDANSNSATNWMVAIDKTNHNIAVLHRESKTAQWLYLKQAKCSVGMHTSHETTTLSGNWTVAGKYLELTHYGYTDWYHTNVAPVSVTQMEIHSVLYRAYSKTALYDGRLGMDISYGCVRTTLDMAKYIYDCVPHSSRIYVFD